MKVLIHHEELYPVWLLSPAPDGSIAANDVPDELVARLAKAEREYFDCLQLIHKVVTVESGKEYWQVSDPDCPWSHTSGEEPDDWWEKL
jgi:hypothetical protein